MKSEKYDFMVACRTIYFPFEHMWYAAVNLKLKKIIFFFHAFHTMKSKETAADYHYKSCEFGREKKNIPQNGKRTVIASEQRLKHKAQSA